jgi:hypothetical protein
VELDGEEANVPLQTVIPLGVAMPYTGNRTHAFSNLDPICKQPRKPYWSYLTLNAMKVYEKVYHVAKDPITELVHCKYSQSPLNEESDHHPFGSRAG